MNTNKMPKQTFFKNKTSEDTEWLYTQAFRLLGSKIYFIENINVTETEKENNHKRYFIFECTTSKEYTNQELDVRTSEIIEYMIESN